jgi:hypothetical protein
MKEYYSNFEKKAIKYLVENKNKKITVESFLGNNVKDIPSIVPEFKEENINKERIDFTPYESLFNIISLLKNLLKDNYIELYGSNDTSKKEKSNIKEGKNGQFLSIDNININHLLGIIFLSKWKGDGKTYSLYLPTINMFDTNILDFLTNNKECFIYPLTSLVELYKNNFKTPEQVRYEREIKESKIQTKYSKYAFYVSLFALLLRVSRNNWSDTQKIRAGLLFSLYPKIKEAYNLVDSLRNVFRMKTLDRVNARNRLHEWYQKVAGCSLREVKSARDAVRFKEEEVLNYFINRSTNAAAESLNSKLKRFRAQLHGVSDLPFFMYRVSLIFG